jgi:hypothetical protein
MSKPGHFILQSICFKCQGDVGPLTSYTNHRGIVMFLKAWLRDPASPKQITHRNRIRACAANWKKAPKPTRDNYERATKKQSLYLNGYNMWVCASMNPTGRAAIKTLERQTGLTLPLPPIE